MEDCEVDRRLLRALCQTLGADPDGPAAPDIDAIAQEDATFAEKKEDLRRELLATFDRRTGG